MNIKQLNAAQSIFKEVQELDSEIIAIDKVAIQIAQGNCEIKLTLAIKDTSKTESKQVLDGDGSLVQSYQSIMDSMLGLGRFSALSNPWGSPEPAKPKDTTDHQYSVSDSVTLGILGVLLCEKQEKRRQLMVKLSKMGVTL